MPYSIHPAITIPLLQCCKAFYAHPIQAEDVVVHINHIEPFLCLLAVLSYDDNYRTALSLQLPEGEAMNECFFLACKWSGKRRSDDDDSTSSVTAVNGVVYENTFFNRPLGQNVLGSIVKTICRESGVHPIRTNHALRYLCPCGWLCNVDSDPAMSPPMSPLMVCSIATPSYPLFPVLLAYRDITPRCSLSLCPTRTMFYLSPHYSPHSQGDACYHTIRGRSESCGHPAEDWA